MIKAQKVDYLIGATRPPTPGKYMGDVGLDIAADLGEDQSVMLLPGQGTFVWGGFQVQLPDGYFALVLPRSSSNAAGLMVLTGVIDNGYTGRIGCQVYNITCDPITIQNGQRIAQLVLLPAVRPVPLPVGMFTPTDRGHAGWGSSGT